jgi:hypothetical protein
VIFPPRISKLVAFTLGKKKLFFLKGWQICWKKSMELNVVSFFCFCLQGFFFLCLWSLQNKTTQKLTLFPILKRD